MMQAEQSRRIRAALLVDPASVERAPRRAGRGGGTRAACAALLLGSLIALPAALPAQAQWIGSVGGDGSSDAKPLPAPQSPAAVSPPAPGVSPEMAMPASPMGAPPGAMGAGPGNGGVDCRTDIERLKGTLESRGTTLQKAADKKRPPTELCPLFRNFVTAQSNFYSYLRKNKTACGVPDEILSKIKASSGKMASTRDKVCQVAANGGQPAGGGGPPPQGSLSSGLGLQSPLPSRGSSKGGVFDTLGGNALR
ncbi:hypothetical protein MWN34_08890 [Ancylobacter sp. 6x-1]|uniref:Uncharacterized protein n=1 Tax=Ancylobacter crimeensis TaxID=2579147 RepID=A0ABT0DB88_9HYPH|nr:hypothetical protein [Ancylobacter crimeensis]MCK0197027.1 hypothetical protein [Ancylobacter crimeensis]